MASYPNNNDVKINCTGNILTESNKKIDAINKINKVNNIVSGICHPQTGVTVVPLSKFRTILMTLD